VADPQVEVGLLSGTDHDYVVLVNHGAAANEGQVAVTAEAGQAILLEPGGPKAVSLKDDGWTYRLEGFSGAVYEVIKNRKVNG
jgi:urease beta subunit